jgi:hypothetical protein
MTNEMDTTNGANGDTQRTASGLWLGIFLIGLGILLFTGWWWPGIMVVLGLAGCAALVFRGQTAKGIGTLAFFWGIALIAIIVQKVEVPWAIVGPLVLIGIGVIVLVRAFFLRTE